MTRITRYESDSNNDETSFTNYFYFFVLQVNDFYFINLIFARESCEAFTLIVEGWDCWRKWNTDYGIRSWNKHTHTTMYVCRKHFMTCKRFQPFLNIIIYYLILEFTRDLSLRSVSPTDLPFVGVCTHVTELFKDTFMVRWLLKIPMQPLYVMLYSFHIFPFARSLYYCSRRMIWEAWKETWYGHTMCCVLTWRVNCDASLIIHPTSNLLLREFRTLGTKSGSGINCINCSIGIYV